jgi:hypothetical protein
MCIDLGFKPWGGLLTSITVSSLVRKGGPGVFKCRYQIMGQLTSIPSTA